MGAKASVHMDGIKSFDVAQSDENERRGKDKEWYDREQDYKGAPNHYDWYRRYLNFEIMNGKIVPQLSHAIPAHQRLKNRLEELGFKSYKATAENTPNIVMDFLVGGDQERLREMAFGNQTVNFEHPDEKNSQLKREKTIEWWAMDTYRWACKRYGEENIVAFNVHLDETTPHIHMQVVPVGLVQKRGRLKAGEERKMVKAVSFAAVVGKNPKELSEYKRDMHTDYHLQVGWKYGLERGTFFEDLTPEEQALRMHLPKHLFVLKEKILEEVKESKKELENINAQKKKAGEELNDVNCQIKQAEKREKALRSMIKNLENNKESLEADLISLEQMKEKGEEITRQIEEKQRLLDEISGKLLDKEEKLMTAVLQLREVTVKKKDVEKKIKVMTDDAIRRHDSINERFKQADQAIRLKREEVTKMDKSGELERAHKHIEDRDAIIYRRWPEARNAVEAIYQLGSTPTARDFTPQQALKIEHALVTSGIERIDAAKDLLSLAQKVFENNRTWKGWADNAVAEVMQIAEYVHPLTPFLQQQSTSGGGGASYINDLTGWDGKKRR